MKKDFLLYICKNESEDLLLFNCIRQRTLLKEGLGMDGTTIIKTFLKEGFEIDRTLMKFIQKRSNPQLYITEILNLLKKISNRPNFLTLSVIEKQILPLMKDSAPKSSGSQSLSAPFKPDIVILKDPTGRSFSTGRVEDFSNHFIYRFKRLSNILGHRLETRDTVPISRVKSIKNSEFGFIGMIRSKNETSKKNIVLELEDETGKITGFISNKNDKLIQKASRLLNDQVLYFKGRKWDSDSNLDAISIEDFLWPNLPFFQASTEITEEIQVVLTSDMHVGSKKFLEKKFLGFLDWLKGKRGNIQEKKLAKKVKYLIIAGDLVDGIGVYEDQEQDLEITDVYLQYQTAASYLSKIPEDIMILIIPGGAHDAIRKALPQPAIPKKYAPDLYNMENVIMLGNPSFVVLHGVNFIIYHGEGFDDIIPAIPGLSYEQPHLCMKEFLIGRHLAPCYGTKTSIIPEKEDILIIDPVPHILHCGHAHVADYYNYRGVKLINSGCWQGLTSFQIERGITPTPAKVPILNLKTLKTQFLQF